MHGCTSSSMKSYFTVVIGQAGNHMTCITPMQIAAAAAALESQRDADTAHMVANPNWKKTFNLHPIRHIKNAML